MISGYQALSLQNTCLPGVGFYRKAEMRDGRAKRTEPQETSETSPGHRKRDPCLRQAGSLHSEKPWGILAKGSKLNSAQNQGFLSKSSLFGGSRFSRLLDNDESHQIAQYISNLVFLGVSQSQYLEWLTEGTHIEAETCNPEPFQPHTIYGHSRQKELS
jgi:hypothetical protein